MTHADIAERPRLYVENDATARPACAAQAASSRTALIAALLLAAFPPLQARAQEAEDEQAVKFTITDMTVEGRLIKVAVNKSVLIDLSVPLREARIVNPEIADVHAISPKQLVINGKSFGATQLIVWVDDKEEQVFDIAVDLPMGQLEVAIRAAVPRARVNARGILDRVLLTGTVPDANAAQRVMEIAEMYSENVANHVRVAGVQQVLLRVTVAEINRSATRQLGFNGWIAGDNLHDFFGVQQLDGINPVNIGAARSFGPIGGAAAGAIPFVTDQQGLNLGQRPALSFGFPRVQMQIFIQALRENGLLRVLAEPNLVGISGQEASFLAGGEIPIPIATDERIKIDYKEFGVRLVFTPTVISEDVIRLKIAPELSEPDFTTAVTISGISVPGFSTRRIQTTIELGSGQTFAIGGLLSERTRGISRRIPGLGDIPVLGPLFSSVEYQRDETEFVVLVTPELVEPVSPNQITAVPGAELVAPNDFELFLMGELEGARPASPSLEPRINNLWPVRTEELYGSSAALKVRGPVGPAGSEEGA